MKFKIIANEQTPKTEGAFSAKEIIKNDYRLLDKFISFARRQHNCAGLASNQVSCDGKRIMKPFFAIKTNHFWDIVICPEITEYVGSPVEKIEGCLTWLGRNIVAQRYPEINAKYYNLKGEHIYRRITGFEAQVWQHEYNHLLGIKEDVR